MLVDMQTVGRGQAGMLYDRGGVVSARLPFNVLYHLVYCALDTFKLLMSRAASIHLLAAIEPCITKPYSFLLPSRSSSLLAAEAAAAAAAAPIARCLS